MWVDIRYIKLKGTEVVVVKQSKLGAGIGFIMLIFIKKTRIANQLI